MKALLQFPVLKSPVSPRWCGDKDKEATPRSWGSWKKRNEGFTGGPGTPCSPEAPTSPLGPWEWKKGNVGGIVGTKHPWGQGWGQVALPRAWGHHGKAALLSPGFPFSSFLPPSFPFPFPKLLPWVQPSRDSPTWILLGSHWNPAGSCWKNSPALPACRALRGRRGGLCVPEGGRGNP